MSDQSVEPKQQRVHDALVGYARLLADHYDHGITSQDLSKINLLSEKHWASFGSQRGRREAFDAVAMFLLDRFGVEREPDIVADYRAAALEDAGFHFSGQAMPLVTSDGLPSAASSDERFLDSEFIAIYW